MSLLGKIFVKLGLDSSEYKKGLSDSQTATAQFSGGIKKLGGMIAGAFTVTAIIGFAKRAVQAYSEAEQAAAKLNSVIKATGGIVGISAKEMRDYAADLQSVTTFEDDATIGAMSLLATFKSIRGDVFKQTIASAQDLATIMGGDLQGTVMQLGRALENPIAATRMLRTFGIMLTEDQIAGIKKLVDEQKKEEAQLLILQLIQDKVGGSAKAAAETATGAWKQVGNAIGDFLEALGKAGMEGTPTFAKRLTTELERINTVLSSGLSLFTKWRYVSTTSFRVILGSGDDNKILKRAKQEQEDYNKKLEAAQQIAKSWIGNITTVEQAQKKLNEAQKSGDNRLYMKEAISILNQFIASEQKTITDEIGSLTWIKEKIAALTEERDLITDPYKAAAINDQIAKLEKQAKLLQMTTAELKAQERITAALPKVQGIALPTTVSTTWATPTLPSLAGMGYDPKKAKKDAERAAFGGMTVDEWGEAAKNLKSTIETSLISTFGALGDALGGLENANAGTILAMLLRPFADFAISLGTMILMAGIGIEDLKAGLLSFSGLGSIAAGLALIAIGVGAKAGIAALGSSPSTSSYGGSTSSYSGGYSVANYVSGQSTKVEVFGTLKGQDIVLASDKYNSNKSR